MKIRTITALVLLAAMLRLVTLPVVVQAQSAQATIPTPIPQPPLPALPTVAPGYGAPEVRPTPGIVGVTAEPFVGIRLEDAVGMALLKNPSLAVSASNARIGGYQVVESKAPFDLRFQVAPSSSYSVQPPENAFLAGPGTVTIVPSPEPIVSFGPTGASKINNPGDIVQHQSTFQYGLGGQTVSGTTYTAGIEQSRTYNNTTFNSYNPYYIASLNLGVTQPLLRNLGMSPAKRQLKLSYVNADNDNAQALVDASNTISQVEDAYWDLVAAWRNVAIQEEALKEAIAQQQSNVRLAKHGAAAPIDAVESQTQVSNFQDNVYSALQTVSEIQNNLKGLIVSDPGDPIWRANLVPTSDVQQVPTPGDLSTIIALANEHRPEVRQALDKRKQAEIDRAYAKSQALPEADVNAAYMSNGFAGLPLPLPGLFNFLACSTSSTTGIKYCPEVPGDTRGSMAYAYHNLWNNLFPTFNIGLTVSFPLQNDLAKGLKGTAQEEERQADVLTQSVAERIQYEARNALQTYEAALSRLNASREGREAAEQVYASELRKFKNGASTTFLVLQRQVTLEQARGRELLAQTDLNKSVVEVERVEGTILTLNGVNLETMGSKALSAQH